MKKRILFLITIILLLAGCAQKKETPAEIMKKVDENIEVTDFREMIFEGEMSIDYGGSAMTFPLDIVIKGDHLSDLSELVMEVQTDVQLLGEKLMMKAYYQDGIIYMDDGTVKSVSSMDLQGLKFFEELTLKDVDYSVYDEIMTVQEVEDGFVLEGVIQTEELNAGLKAFLPEELLNEMPVDFDMQFSEMKIQWHISSDYHVINEEYQIGMTIQIGDELTDVDLKFKVTTQNHKESLVKLPDLSEWSQRKTACKVETDTVSTVILVEAEGETVELLQISYFFSYEGYGLSTKTEKAYLKQLVEETYSPYQEYGINMVIQDDDEDVLILSMGVDYQNASREALDILGISGGLTYSQLLGDTEGLDCTNY